MLTKSYVLSSDAKGIDRLGKLFKITSSATSSLLKNQLCAHTAINALEIGCGTGHGTKLLAPYCQHLLATDPSDVFITSARGEIASVQISNVTFRTSSFEELTADESISESFDLVYLRYVLQHLPKPLDALQEIYKLLKPNALIIIEDFDVSQRSYYPENDAVREYIELYQKIVAAKKGDAEIGRKLPLMLSQAGFLMKDFSIQVPTPGTQDAAILSIRTLQEASCSAVKAGLCTISQIENVCQGLQNFSNLPGAFLSSSHVFQFVGVKL
jgi:ubiquinone/menaquinone biosynthesis C-methylase UbiE